jgi:uncharacterized protein with PIN domain
MRICGTLVPAECQKIRCHACREAYWLEETWMLKKEFDELPENDEDMDIEQGSEIPK